MRKIMSVGLLAIMFTVLGTAPAAATDSQNNPLPTMQEPQLVVTDDVSEPAPVECTMLNFTDPALFNPDYSYNVGTPINLELYLNDPDHVIVGYVVFTATLNNVKGAIIQQGPQTSVVFTPTAPGAWHVAAQLYNMKGNEIVPTGDCDVDLTVVAPAPPKPPTKLQKFVHFMRTFFQSIFWRMYK